jgi:hypothetical protein
VSRVKTKEGPRQRLLPGASVRADVPPATHSSVVLDTYQQDALDAVRPLRLVPTERLVNQVQAGSACANRGDREFYRCANEPDEVSRERAAQLCVGCSPLLACREWSLRYPAYGVWGGLAPADQQVIRQARRAVGS